MAVQWADNVNQKVLKDGSSWGEIEGFISDPTLSGKQKRRMSATMAKRQFTVSMHFTYTEYSLFTVWYKNSLHFGTLSFDFPRIDGTGTAEYRIAEGGAPKYSNVSGKIIQCDMIWEEVNA